MLTLEDIERRAKARGWVVDRHGTRHARVYSSGGQYVASLVVDAFGAWYCNGFTDDRDADYLETGAGPEAREGAARVLSVVAQVAAMQCAALLQADMVRALSSTSDALEQQADDWRSAARELRREVLRLRHRLRSRNDCHPSGDRLRPDDLDALLYRANLAPLEQAERTEHLARELRGRREHGASAFGWPRAVHGPKGRLP